MTKRTAIYAGSFDPPTHGHLDIIERACKLFDHITVAVATNTSKTGAFSSSERIDMLTALSSHIDNVNYVEFGGLTVDLAKELNAVALIRGLRAVSDFEYEMTMAATNRKMYPACETVCLMPSEQFMFISSRLVKEIVLLGGNVEHFVSPLVVERLREKLLS